MRICKLLQTKPYTISLAYFLRNYIRLINFLQLIVLCWFVCRGHILCSFSTTNLLDFIRNIYLNNKTEMKRRCLTVEETWENVLKCNCPFPVYKFEYVAVSYRYFNYFVAENSTILMHFRG